ncbi:MAG TPA: hypothetical protein VFT75_04055 [Nocardioidaceae bacterium]|jgi:hypothetical protein|nr:hypothetical protein [Nocardioidaceae bacterium]
MNTDQLRTLLHERGDVDDGLGPVARVEQVHDRMEAVRRRRRTMATAAVAVLVAAGASVVPALRHRDPGPTDAPAELAGRTVPKTQTAAGYTYDYVRGVQSRPGADDLRLAVTAVTGPKLVMWATSSDNPAPVVRLTSNVGPEHLRSAAGGFDRYMLVYPRDTAHLKLTQLQAPAGNRLALAVYELDRTPPPGVSNGVVTFRKDILDDRLAAGLIGKPGQTDLRTTMAAVHGPIRYSDLCYGAGSQDYVHVSFGGREVGASSCARQPTFDPGVDGGSFTAAQSPLPAQGPVQVHVWLTGKKSSPATGTSQAVIGFALYRLGEDTFPLAGWEIPARQESDGHEYLHSQSFQSQPGQRALTVTIPPSDVPRLVTTADSGHTGDYALTELVVDDRGAGSFEDATGGGGSWSSGYVIQPGESPTLTFRLARGTPGRTVLGIALSDQVH